MDVETSNGPNSWPWPLAMQVGWSALCTDGTWHASYWIAEWPRFQEVGDSISCCLLLIGSSERRSLAFRDGAGDPAGRPRRRKQRAPQALLMPNCADVMVFRLRPGTAVNAKRLPSARKLPTATRLFDSLAMSPSQLEVAPNLMLVVALVSNRPLHCHVSNCADCTEVSRRRFATRCRPAGGAHEIASTRSHNGPTGRRLSIRF